MGYRDNGLGLPQAVIFHPGEELAQSQIPLVRGDNKLGDIHSNQVVWEPLMVCHWDIRGASWWMAVAGGRRIENESKGVEQCGLGLVSTLGSYLSWLESELQPS